MQIGLQSQIITFQDINFKNKLLQSSPSNSIASKQISLQNSIDIKIDANNDGEIEISEALEVNFLIIGLLNGSGNITSLDGIQYFTNLKALDCSYNQISTIPVTNLSNLTFLNCEKNQISTIDVSGCVALREFRCNTNPLGSLNVNGLLNLNVLDVSETPLVTIDCSQTAVTQLVCINNPNLQSINVQNNTSGYDDPDVLFFQFQFMYLPSLLSICIDNTPTEIVGLNNASYSIFSNNNVSVFTGSNCTLSNNIFEKHLTKIYPNPFSTTINIDSEEKIENYSLTDLLGKILINSTDKKIFDNQCFNLSNGVYLLKLTFYNNQYHIEKLIKN